MIPKGVLIEEIQRLGQGSRPDPSWLDLLHSLRAEYQALYDELDAICERAGLAPKPAAKLTRALDRMDAAYAHSDAIWKEGSHTYALIIGRLAALRGTALGVEPLGNGVVADHCLFDLDELLEFTRPALKCLIADFKGLQTIRNKWVHSLYKLKSAIEEARACFEGLEGQWIPLPTSELKDVKS